MQKQDKQNCASLKEKRRQCSYVPLCFPRGSSYFTPTQWPVLKSVVPAMNVTTMFLTPNGHKFSAYNNRVY